MLAHAWEGDGLVDPRHPVGLADVALLEACRRRELSAFERLYAEQGERMKSVACNMLGNGADAEDAVQEAFLKVYRSIDSFKGEAALATWIYRILVNACHDIARARRRRLEDSDEPRLAATAAAGADRSLTLALERGLARLSPRDREVFVLFEVEGFRHREIAQILEIPEGTSKSLLFKAKRELQRVLLADRRRGTSR